MRARRCSSRWVGKVVVKRGVCLPTAKRVEKDVTSQTG